MWNNADGVEWGGALGAPRRQVMRGYLVLRLFAHGTTFAGCCCCGGGGVGGQSLLRRCRCNCRDQSWSTRSRKTTGGTSLVSFPFQISFVHGGEYGRVFGELLESVSGSTVPHWTCVDVLVVCWVCWVTANNYFFEWPFANPNMVSVNLKQNGPLSV